MAYSEGMRMKNLHWMPISALILSSLVYPIGAVEVRMAADTLSIHATQAPLSEILGKLQETGIRVAMDERIDPLITANFENRETGDGIKYILRDCDYALSWKTIDGPAGRLRRLDEVLVYKPGDRRLLTPRPAPPPALGMAPASQTNAVTCIKGDILLRLRPGVTADQLKTLLMKTGAMVLDGIPALGIYRLRLPQGSNLAAAINALNTNPLVDHAEPNQVYKPISTVKSGDANSIATPRTITANGGPAVAILDSGLNPDATLAKAVVASLDATSPGQVITDPQGHGTQMALIASGAVTPMGTEPPEASVSIIPIRTLDNNGIVSSFSLMQSMVFATENGAKVINMSWGSSNNDPFFNDAIAYAQQHGIIMVAAAGNEPTGQPLYPAALPDVIAVAAMGEDGNLWSQSNYGNFVDFAAPSFAALPVGYKGNAGVYGGTSIAAAYTANILAQYLAGHPNADAPSAIAALKKTLSPAPAGSTHPEIPRLSNASVSAYLK